MPKLSTDSSITRTLANARRALLNSRIAAGYWEGELSSSALSTATAVFALWVYLREARSGKAGAEAIQKLIRHGAAWLARYQNPDGGWGDTTDSISNISTTALCWAALSRAGETQQEMQAVGRAGAWLAIAATSDHSSDLHAGASGAGALPCSSDSNAAPPRIRSAPNPGRRGVAAISDSTVVGAACPGVEDVRGGKLSVTANDAGVPGLECDAGSLALAAEETLRCAQGDGLTPSVDSASGPRGGDDRESARNSTATISVDPAALAEAIARRYGKDRTFSVPILTFCALAERLGSADRAWELVPQLPFELAALPQSWFRFARLPVVSYALPALIAIGHVRHHHRPTRNPFARLARRLAGARTLRVLTAIQPRGGGFLEATPLTSFVVMSLAAGGRAEHPVVSRGIDFLIRSARPDGSWPIDTNLATWVTTLSVNALAASGGVAQHLDSEERKAISTWIIGQQYRVRHPYTGAPPGGWAWTDLPGGVPDADDTAGALLALLHLGDADAAALDAARAGVRWLLGLQNRDGGIPTFCRGWGKLPFDRSAPDLTAHVLLAFKAWRDQMPVTLSAEMDSASLRAIAYLQSSQRSDGSWVPLWFGNQAAPDDENPTYGTSRVVAALNACDPDRATVGSMTGRGVEWLLLAQNADGGWGGAQGVSSSVEETCQAIVALAMAAGPVSAMAVSRRAPREKSSGFRAEAIVRGIEWIARRTSQGQSFSSTPIGLYFAKLWYSERLYPLIAVNAALGAALSGI